MVLPGLGNDAIHQGVIEFTFLRLELRPRDSNEHCVQIASYELGPDGLHGFKSGSCVVAQLPGENQEGLPVDDQLRGVAVPFEVWLVVAVLCLICNRQAGNRKKQSEERQATDAHSSLQLAGSTGRLAVQISSPRLKLRHLAPR